MSHYRQKRLPSRSRAPKREDYNPRRDSYHHHQHHPTQSNRQYDYHYPSDRPISINEIISHTEEYPPIVQSLVRELLLEQGKQKLTEERLNRAEHENAALRIQYEQAMNSLALLKRDFDQYRSEFKTNPFELNELRHSNSSLYRPLMEPHLNNERQMYINDELFYPKRQRRH